jgi:hypothetical protein
MVLAQDAAESPGPPGLSEFYCVVRGPTAYAVG